MTQVTAGAYVLVVEDDPKIARLLQDYLKREGLESLVLADGAAALQQVTTCRPALVVLDVMLPGLDGVEVCRGIRVFSDVPIIMLTARIDELDRLLGLETGADDYVCKPFSPREVMARVQALLRRSQGRLNRQPALWTVDDEKLRVDWRGHTLGLTLLEFRMFRLLLSRPGRVFSRSQLLDTLHADERDVSDRAVDSHVKNLRRKVQSVDPAFDGVVSVYGVGYRFDAPVTPALGSPPPASAEQP